MDAPDLVANLRTADTAARERAWRALFDAHYTRVFRLVCRFGVTGAEAEDVVQRAFVIALERIDEVENLRDPPAWLRGIVVRVVASHRRWRRVREVKKWLVRDTRVAELGPVATPEQHVAAAQDVERARRVLSQLSAKLRDVLVLCDIEDCPPREVSAHLKIPVNTVRSRRRLAKEQFTKLWQREFGEQSLGGPRRGRS